MKSILDTCYSVLLQSVDYRNEGELKILIKELFKTNVPETIEVSKNLGIPNAYPIEISRNSKVFEIFFENAIFHQIIDESFFGKNDNTIIDTPGLIQIVKQSKYEKYINENFGWYKNVIGEAEFYRILCGTEVIEVVAITRPILREI